MSELTWQKSSYCGNGGNNCVEVTIEGGHASIRDSVVPEISITLRSTTFNAFIVTIKAGTVFQE